MMLMTTVMMVMVMMTVVVMMMVAMAMAYPPNSPPLLPPLPVHSRRSSTYFHLHPPLLIPGRETPPRKHFSFLPPHPLPPPPQARCCKVGGTGFSSAPSSFVWSAVEAAYCSFKSVDTWQMGRLGRTGTSPCCACVCVHTYGIQAQLRASWARVQPELRMYTPGHAVSRPCQLRPKPVLQALPGCSLKAVTIALWSLLLRRWAPTLQTAPRLLLLLIWSIPIHLRDTWLLDLSGLSSHLSPTPPV
eukprot:1155518-Pelagomonas_calceolata.AAC.10